MPTAGVNGGRLVDDALGLDVVRASALPVKIRLSSKSGINAKTADNSTWLLPADVTVKEKKKKNTSGNCK